MTTRATYVWKHISAVVGYEFTKGAKYRFMERYHETGLLDVDAHVQRYLEANPQEKGASDVPFTLMRLIESGDWPPPPPPPVAPLAEPDALRLYGFTGVKDMPPLIQAIVENCVADTEISEDYGLAVALACVAASVGNRVRIKAWNRYQFANEYILLIGPPKRSHKTASCDYGKQLIGEVDWRLLAPHGGSVEGLIEALGEYASLFWVRDEFGGLLKAIRGQDYMGPMREMMLELFSHAGLYKRQMAKGRIYKAEDPVLNILSGIQTDRFAELMVGREVTETGFLGRFLLVDWLGAPETWPVIEPWEADRQAIRIHLRRLAQAPQVTVEARALQRLAGIWRGSEEEVFGEWGPKVAQRGETHAIKLATLLWCADKGSPRGGMIPDEYLSPALALLERWFKRSSALIEEVHIKEAAEVKRRDLLAYVRRSKNGGRTRGEMLKAQQLSGRQLDDYVEALVQRGDLRAWTDDDGSEHWRVP